MKRIKTKFQRFLLVLLFINLRLSNSVTIGDEVVHIKFHLPPNAIPFGQPQVIHHTHTEYEHHNRRRNPSNFNPIQMYPHKYHIHSNMPKRVYADPQEEIDDPKTQESVHNFDAIESMAPKSHHQHHEAYDERYNYRPPSDGYHSQFKESERIHFSPNKHRVRPIQDFEPDESDFEQENSNYRHQSEHRDLERGYKVHDSYVDDKRYPYSHKIRNSALKVVEPKLSHHHYSKHYDSDYSKRSYRKPNHNPFKPMSYSHVHHNHKYSYDDPSNNEPLTMDSLYEESNSYKPLKNHYKTISEEYYNPDPISGYNHYHKRTPPKYVKFTANDSYLPKNRHRMPTHHSSYKTSDPYTSIDSYRIKPKQGLGLQGYEYSSSYPWL